MSDLQVIETAVKRSAQRRRFARAFRGMCVGLLAGALLSLLASGIHHLVPLPDWVLGIVILAPVAGGVLGLIAGAWRTPLLQETARWVDSRERLQERLGTALEMGKGQETGSWRELVISDAAEHARKLDPRRLVPYSLNRAATWSLLVLAMVAGLAFIPEYRSKSYLQKQTDAQNIREVGKQLSDLTKQNLAKRPPVLPETQKSMESVQEAGSRLSKGEVSRAEALKDLASLTEKLKSELHNLGQDPALRRMEQAARSSGAPDSQTSAAIQRELAALQKQLGSPSATPESLEKALKQLDQLREAASGNKGNNGEMSKEDREKLSAGLSALSSQMQSMGLQVPEIEEAIKALAANQTEMLLKDLQAASADLEKLKDLAKSMQQMQQQVEKMGKDLAEQLQNGQPEAAHMTLQKMIQELKAANLTPEQLKELMQQVSKAVNPASNYGQVADHLKKAAAQMQAGNKQSAAQDLANASKELEKLMQQLGDAQQLAAELRTLNQASMAIANGQCWGLNPGRPMAGNKRGRGGPGVGTWAEDEGAAWDGQVTDPFDNTGLTRPDMDSRGITDRGDPQLNEALMPTKVKGQFSPGNQMPSVTLKGVSIRGQSSVEYQSAAAAAQSEAESALSQEKVPRAYQGAVKEYFDDLPKTRNQSP